MKRLLWLFLLVLSFTLACQQETSQVAEEIKQESREGGSYRTALPFRPKILDPALSTDIYSVTLIQQLFDGLVQFDQNLNVMPALATNWKVTSDGLVYTFNLRQDAAFHNGRQVTAEDFIYSFSRILNPKLESSALSFFQRIKGAEAYRSGESSEVVGLKALSPYILEITLREPFAPFLSLLAMKSSKLVPREEVERWGEDFGKHPVGTGPFRLESFAEDRIALVANVDYFEGRPYLDKAVYTVYPGAQNEKMAEDFLKGHLEEAPVYGTIREQISGEENYRLVRKPSLSLLFYGMNCRIEPLSNPMVRQAINYAINKRQIVGSVYKNQFVAAYTILPPGMPGYTPENSTFSYDPQKAKKLLADAGYGPTNPLPTLTLVSASQSMLAQKEFDSLKKDLAVVGINLKVIYQTDWPTFEALLRQGDFMLYRYAWFADIPDPDNFLAILCGAGSRYNFMNYSNQRVEKLLSEALTQVDQLKRAALYREAEALILREAPMVPLLYLTFESAFQTYVKGLEISALGGPYIPLKKIWLDQH
jgi:peptide/nickel transport system substrate-binding protein/oligopeptide transport system substrate-binding protein